MDDKTWLGNLAEAKVATYLVQERYEVFTAFGGKTKCDILAMKDEKIFRIQVKGTRTRSSKNPASGSWQVQIRSVRSNKTQNVIHKFDASDSDYIGIYIEPEDRVILLESAGYDGRSYVSIKPI